MYELPPFAFPQTNILLTDLQVEETSGQVQLPVYLDTTANSRTRGILNVVRTALVSRSTERGCLLLCL